ncbi:MAG: ECF transporter S component [Gemmiger sp.]|nr:ECF transporter S component [Gemmiger sp.]
MKTSKANVRGMTQLALLVALVLVMAYTPLGYLPVGPLSLSLLTIPVAIGAMLLGPGAGAVLGTVFGLTSFLSAMQGQSVMGSALFSANPFFCFINCVVARLLCGLLCGLLYRALRRALPGRTKTSCALGALSAPVLNTILFMGCLVLLFYRTPYVQNLAAGLGSTNPFTFVVVLVGVQGLVEAVSCCAIATAVTLPLLKILGKEK